ncbi:MAG: DUF192 domain-containing protein [Endomicrobium sp.]|nr:DUF192 domain-containing protein [Endomicrobium sp.]
MEKLNIKFLENAVTIKKADSFFKKFAGFMLKRRPDYAILFENCSRVHTFFMRFNLDILFLDSKGAVAAIKKNVKPWRIVLPVKNAVSILEIPSYLSNYASKYQTENLIIKSNNIADAGNPEKFI